MSIDQVIIFSVLAGALVMFVWNRLRYDAVAIVALLIVTLTGLIPPDKMFSGFGHPAVVTVAAVLVLSRGLQNAGVVDWIARILTKVGDNPTIQVATLTSIVAFCSAFMNNVGALALLMPVAIWMSRRSGNSPSILLMPLAFGSLLGGMLTMIGTPPNIIIATFREQSGQAPFGMFDFLPVGSGVAIAGILFISLIGWRLTPQRKENGSNDELFNISEYISEVKITQASKFIGKTLHDLYVAIENESDVDIIGLVRNNVRTGAPSTYEVLQEDDVLIVRADSDGLTTLTDIGKFELAESVPDENDKEQREAGDVSINEVIVSSDSMLIGKNATRLNIRERFGINVLAVARHGKRLKERVGKISFVAGDILLIQGREENLKTAINALGCLPLAERGMRLGKPQKTLFASGIFGSAIALVTLGILPAPVALTCGAVVMVLTGLISKNEVYESVDWPVIILLAAMIPVGMALETTGGAQLIANHLLGLAQYTSTAGTIAIVIIATMFLSDVINNAAAAILVAPIAMKLAQGMEMSADPLLMAVAIGASCAFLTPIGHQSNTLVMKPGGYKFGDYWRMGLPLEIIVLLVAVPLIMFWWR